MSDIIMLEICCCILLFMVFYDYFKYHYRKYYISIGLNYKPIQKNCINFIRLQKQCLNNCSDEDIKDLIYFLVMYYYKRKKGNKNK